LRRWKHADPPCRTSTAQDLYKRAWP
jgi:hypothetical protein